MRSRVPAPNPPRSVVENAEFGLTAILVLVVVVALLQICGIPLGLRS